MHRQFHLVMYYVFAQRFLCVAYVLHMTNICVVFVAIHLDIVRIVHVHKC